MKTGILYICTGKYEVFWKDFYETAEKYLLPGIDKHYFVFTDSKSIQPDSNVHLIFQQQLGWPRDTLMRFHLFLQHKEVLEQMEYLFFFNANYTFIRPVTAEALLPDESGHFLTGQIHPVAYHKHRNEFDYESNPASAAYIPADEGQYYFAGGLIGGRTPEFLRMCETLSKNIDADEANQSTARWHDESHINKYFSRIQPRRLHPGYCYPQGWYLPFEPMTLLRDKSLLGGHAFLRGQNGGKQQSQQFRTRMFKYKLYIRAALFKIFGYSPL